MNINSEFGKLTLSLLLLMGLTGCAALTVDVDVYKGPLANHEEVQTEQLTVMAIGAKPILIQLRNGLEETRMKEIKAESDGNPPKYSIELCKKEPDTWNIRSCEGYSFGHIKNYNFKDENAGRVNAILGLYEDRDYSNLPVQIEIDVRNIKEELKVFKRERDIFFNKNYDESQKAWKKIQSAFRTGANRGVDKFIKTNTTAKEDYLALKRVELIAEIQQLEAAYEKFFLPSQNKRGRNIQQLSDAREALPGFFNSKSEFINPTGLLKISIESPQGTLPADKFKTMFNLLSNEKNLQWDAAILFPDKKSKIRQEFLDQITRVAGSNEKTENSVKRLKVLFEGLETNLKKYPKLKKYWGEAGYLVVLLKKLTGKPLSGILESKLDTIWMDSNLLTSKLSDPLSRGRWEDGLETQIETYLKNRNKGTGTDEEIKQNLKDLHIGLAHFAEKILFLANYGILLNPYPDNYQLSFAGLDASPVNDLDSYVMVLQAVGNSILFQIDELAVRNEHTAKKKDQWAKRERRAVSALLTKRSYDVVEELIASLEVEKNAAGNVILKEAEWKALKKTIDKAKKAHEKARNGLAEAEKEQKDADTEKTKFESILNATKDPTKNPTKENPGGQKIVLDNILSKTPVQNPTNLNALLDLLTTSMSKGSPTTKGMSKLSIEQIKLLHDFFKDDVPKDAIKEKSGDRKTIYNSIIDYLKTELANAKKGLADADEVVKNAKKAESTAKTNVGKEEDALTDKIAEERTKRENASWFVKKHRIAILDRINNRESKNDPKMVKIVISEILVEELAKVSEKEKNSAAGKIGGKAVVPAKTTTPQAKAKSKATPPDQGSILVSKVTPSVGKPSSEDKPAKKTDDAEKDDDAKAEAPGKNGDPKNKPKDPEKEKPLTDNEKLISANAYLTTRLGDMDFPFKEPEFLEGMEAKEVLDQLIASLRYEHINAVRAGGEKSATAKQIADALKLAYEQRGGMSFIRPAFSYLRNSFPSTSLQADASIEWKNMLLENTVKSLPFADTDWFKDSKTKNRLRINQEIDKQYWQNINRVKLTGGGNTNYVVAKDDLGNWYVKNYSADPKDIIKSAKNLAMFGMGPGLGTNLLSDIPDTGGSVPGTTGLGDQADGAAQQVQGQQAMTPRTPLERQYVKSKKKYDDQSKDALKEIKLIMASLKSDIENSWDKNKEVDSDAMEKIKTTLGTASDTQLKEVEKKAGEDEIPIGEEINKTLKAIKYFKKDLESRINQLNETEETKKANLEKAKKFAISDFKSTISGPLNKFLDKRQKTVENFETAVLFIGESVSP